jgi:cytochrome oxidase Cu insertion factor (SCO1/SenC/PrrC family)
MRTVVLCLVGLLFVTAIPGAIADGDYGSSEQGYHGLALSRSSIDHFTLTNQNGMATTITGEGADATVVAFIFTRCHDVCPTITQNLKTAQLLLDEEDVNFVSISVDPEYDMPERLAEYTEMHGVDWPHLTGTLEEVEPVWNQFLVSVDKAYIESHDTTNDSIDGHGDHEISHADSVTVMMPDGNSSEHDVMLNGWHQLTATSYEENWNVVASTSEFGHMVTGINDEHSPSDGAWWWELHTWDSENSTWISSSMGIDSLMPQAIAFAPNTTDDATIPVPMDEHASTTIVNVSGNSSSAMMPATNAWHQSIATLSDYEAPDSEYGHYMNSIGNVSAPDDFSWWWQLHSWNATSEMWEETQVGMDDLTDTMHIAWAPNSTADMSIPSPANMEGTEHDNDESEYATLHTTLTFILDSNGKPRISWSGYQWDVGDFVEDIRKLIDGSPHPDPSDSIPGFTFNIATAALGLAFIASSRDK